MSSKELPPELRIMAQISTGASKECRRSEMEEPEHLLGNKTYLYHLYRDLRKISTKPVTSQRRLEAGAAAKGDSAKC